MSGRVKKAIGFAARLAAPKDRGSQRRIAKRLLAGYYSLPTRERKDARGRMRSYTMDVLVKMFGERMVAR